jgi:hypothetical protein
MPLLPDSWDRDQHLSLKRWERGAQRVAWKQRGAEQAAPPLPCPWRGPAAVAVTLRPAHVLALFTGDLTVVRFAGNAADERDGQNAGIRVLRGAIPWELWAPFLLNAYVRGAPVPEPFRPRLRLPPAWLEQALGWHAADQHALFDKLRAGGALPPLRPITEEAMAPWLRWDEVRTRLIDFTRG